MSFYAGVMTYITQHYQSLLGLSRPWEVSEVIVRHETEEVEVMVEWTGGGLACPECGAGGQRHDGRRRRWRHLDTMQYQTWLVAEVPRVRCAVHGVRQVVPPWAEANSRFTARFEGLVIAWLLEASGLAVSAAVRSFLGTGGEHPAPGSAAGVGAPGAPPAPPDGGG